MIQAGDAHDDPAVDREFLAQSLNVCHQVIGGVDREIDRGIVSPRSASPAAALIKQHRAKYACVEVPSRERRAAATGSAVQIHDRDAGGIADRLPVDVLTVADL